MVFHSQDQNLKPQNPISAIDDLYCEEDRFDDEVDLEDDEANDVDWVNDVKNRPLTMLDCELFWDDDELESLLSKEKEPNSGFSCLISDGSLMGIRKEALDWILRVIEHYGFTAKTALLAVNYFDRFISGLCFQKDKPWMSQLVAVACLSLAAKVEETQVPILLDLQVANSKFVFEAKTIQRMELLVLSTLQWKMNPVTPLSFIDHIIRRFGLMTKLHFEFMRMCERIVLGIFTDSRLLHYPPSVIATAIMFFVINEIEPCNAMEYLNQLMRVLEVRKDSVDECHELILDLMDIPGSKISQIHKRKRQSTPSSPNGVIDAYFSCENSNDSWAVASSSPEPQYKRNRT